MSRIAHNGKLRMSSTVIGLADQSYELKTLGEAECDITLRNLSKSTQQTVVVVETAGYEMFLEGADRAGCAAGRLPQPHHQGDGGQYVDEDMRVSDTRDSAAAT